MTFTQALYQQDTTVNEGQILRSLCYPAMDLIHTQVATTQQFLSLVIHPYYQLGSVVLVDLGYFLQNHSPRTIPLALTEFI